MRLFRVLPALTLLLGARASPRVLDSREPPHNRVEARQIGTNLCVPIEITSTIVGLLPFGLAYVTEGSGASRSTFFNFNFIAECFCVPERLTGCLCLSTIPSAIAVEVIQYAYEFAPEPTNEFINDFVNSVCDPLIDGPNYT